jgi:sugar lactone lactonase YvrE
VRSIREVAAGFSYLESPRWHQERLWVSDFYTHRVLAVDTTAGTAETIVEVEGQPSGLGWLPDGSLLVTSMLDRTVLRFSDGVLGPHADLSSLATGPVNDMVVDLDGRAWVGNFGYDLMAEAEPTPTALIRVDPDGTVHTVADGLLFPNGTVVTPRQTLIVAETVGRRLTAFDIDDGNLVRRRTWADFDDPAVRAITGRPILPDGISLDAAGCIWVADALSGRVIRVEEGGTVLEEIAVDIGAFACMLGGPDGTTLFICGAPSHLAHERRHTRDSVLLAVEVDVPRAGLP